MAPNSFPGTSNPGHFLCISLRRDLDSTHDKPPRRVSDVIKRKTSDERESRFGSRVEHADITRLHHLGGIHPISTRSPFRRHQHHIALLNIPQATEESVAMSGEHYITCLSW